MTMHEMPNTLATTAETTDAYARLRRSFFLLAGVGAALMTVLFWTRPSFREALISENGLLENAGALFFLCGFLAGLPAALKHHWRNTRLLPRLLCLSIPVLSLLGFLDETSFGAMWFGEAQATENTAEGILLFGYNVDGVHDILSLSFKLLRDHCGLVGYTIASVLLGAGIGFSILKRRSYMPAIMQGIRATPSLDYLRIAIILIGTGMILDLDIYAHSFAYFLEELLEMNGAFALFAGAISLWIPPAPRTTPETAA